MDSSDQMLLTYLPAEAKIYSVRSFRKQNFPSPIREISSPYENNLLLNDYLWVKKEIFQFYLTCSQIDQFKRDDSILP